MHTVRHPIFGMAEHATATSGASWAKRVLPRHENVNRQYYRSNAHRVLSGYSLQDVVLFAPVIIVFLVTGLSEGNADWPWLVLMLSLSLIAVRIGFGQGGVALARDILQHMDLAHADPKERFRSNWTNSAVVNALLLTFALPMLQLEIDEIPYATNSSEPWFEIVGFTRGKLLVYRCACLNAVAFGLAGTILPSLALSYSEHLSVKDTVNFIICFPWTIGAPLMCTLSTHAAAQTLDLPDGLCVLTRPAFGPSRVT